MTTIAKFVDKKAQEYSELADELRAGGIASSAEHSYNMVLVEIMTNIYKWEQVKEAIEEQRELLIIRL